MDKIDNTSKMIGTHLPGPTSKRLPYHPYARLIEIGCITTMLRNFPISSLKEDELEEFLRLQNYFTDLEAKCFDEAGFE